MRPHSNVAASKHRSWPRPHLQFSKNLDISLAHSLGDDLWPQLEDSQKESYRRIAKERRKLVKDLREQGQLLEAKPANLLDLSTIAKLKKQLIEKVKNGGETESEIPTSW